MMLSTRTLASASARHPWRTIGAWVAVIVLAILAIGTFLSLTTEGAPTNNPESERADEVLSRGVPAGSLNGRHRHCHCPLRHLRGGLAAVRDVRAFVDDDEITALGRANTYLDDAGAGLVSEDRHATIVPIALRRRRDGGARREGRGHRR